MNILITGINGYVGSVLGNFMYEKGYNVKGLDNNYYEDCLLQNIQPKYKTLIKDIRDIEISDFNGIDCVIHLASISNDPLGELDPDNTYDINYKATIKLAEYAKKNKVKKFIFASSQSIYGISKTKNEINEDTAIINPITAYAKSKWMCEEDLKKLSDSNFNVVFLRPSTVFGSSPRMRCDIVYNNLLAYGFTTKEIQIMSDGSPWRPIVHINDLCLAFYAVVNYKNYKDLNNQAFNVGIDEGNYTVKEMANKVKSLISDTNLIFKNQHSDPRTYKVSFNKIYEFFEKDFKPKYNLDNGGLEIINFFSTINLNYKTFNSSKCIRIKKIKELIKNKKINEKLKWL
tara:strand:+ start:34 stop:1065 length:1032 start_codon:yes stop_codon:yes gene_type:complete